ncbi:hypothetical protein [Flavobacterium sp.]|uniref:toxin-antitoxin system YwqK family antitoxin n=1 Tax=Flavobacterium sp. TaxID=239 RepID=UPI002639DDAE|nr:hypothetical protein [Flavobacterium sp.]MDG2431139.1 hypothetical protein [Flavobacterium sp.]
MIKSIFILILLSVCIHTAEKTYYKDYYENGKIKSEGWILDNQKVDYWFYYYENGKKKEEGHYNKNKKVQWWLYYDANEIILKKAEFKNNIQEGLTLVYKNGSLVKAEKYLKGVKIKEWTSLSKYKRDNP